MVYYTDNFNLSKEERDFFFRKMPKDRQEKYLKFKHDLNKNQCIVAYLLLEYGLKSEFDVNPPLNISNDIYDKPYLPDYPQIHFNISHCKTGIACALSQNPIGADIQDFREYNPKAAKKLCNREQWLEISQLSNPEVEFTKLWTRFESVYKYFSYEPKNIPDNLIFTQMQTDKFILTVCSERSQEFQRVPLENLTHMNVR